MSGAVPDVIIVGGGVAGLACARRLHEAGRSFVLLDYEALDLKRIYAGALVRFGGRWHRVADPFRYPWDGLRGVRSPVGTF